MELKILSTLWITDSLLVTGKLTAGDLYGLGAEYLFCKETGSKWKLTGIGFPGLKHEEGIRSFELTHVEGSKVLQEGFTIIAEPKDLD